MNLTTANNQLLTNIYNPYIVNANHTNNNLFQKAPMA